jgi:hypothetical protein
VVLIYGAVVVTLMVRQVRRANQRR